MPFRPLNNGGPSSAAPAGPPGTEQERPGIMWTVEVREEGAPSPNGPPPHTEAGQTAPEGPVPPSSTTDGSGQAPPPHRPQAPRMPPFFFVTPDGATHPGFFPIPPPHLAPQPPGNQPHPPMIGAPVPPWMTFGQPPPMFSFFMPVPMPSEPQPDPVKAAELIRSLPAVGKNLMKRIDRIISAEGPRRGDDDLEHGWKCGICLEGVEDAESKETGVKALPCNHLYHSACLEPWLTTRHTW